jgi:outer membrane lipoprotein-sorting protein
MHKYTRIQVFFLLLAILPLSGCLFRSSHPVQVRMSTATLKDATLEELVDKINSNAAQLNSFKATVDIDSTHVEQKKGKAKDNPQLRGILLARKPEMLRMVVLMPLVRNTLADMVSDSHSFRLSIPPRKEFRVGSNQLVGKLSPQWFENVRPQHIKDAMLLKPIDPANEIVILEDGMEIVKDPKSHKDVQQPTYVVSVIGHDSNGYYIPRKVIFSRTDLLPHQQLIYSREGRLVTEAHYENFVDHGGTMFPDIIEVHRPIEDYTITLSVVKLNLNEPLTDDQFTIAQPAGFKVINMDDEKEESGQNQSALRKP